MPLQNHGYNFTWLYRTGFVDGDDLIFQFAATRLIGQSRSVFVCDGD